MDLRLNVFCCSLSLRLGAEWWRWWPSEDPSSVIAAGRAVQLGKRPRKNEFSGTQFSAFANFTLLPLINFAGICLLPGVLRATARSRAARWTMTSSNSCCNGGKRPPRSAAALSLQRRSAAAPQRRAPVFALPRAAHTSPRSRPSPCEAPQPPRAAAAMAVALQAKAPLPGSKAPLAPRKRAAGPQPVLVGCCAADARRWPKRKKVATGSAIPAKKADDVEKVAECLGTSEGKHRRRQRERRRCSISNTGRRAAASTASMLSAMTSPSYPSAMNSCPSEWNSTVDIVDLCDDVRMEWSEADMTAFAEFMSRRCETSTAATDKLCEALVKSSARVADRISQLADVMSAAIRSLKD